MAEVQIPALKKVDADARKQIIVGNPHYDVHLTLEAGEEPTSFASETMITFEASSGASTFIDLVAESVEEIVLNGQVLSPTLWKDGKIPLDGLADHNTVIVKAHCPYRNGGMGMQRSIDPEDKKTYLYTQGEAFEIHSVFACFDQPSIKGTFSMEVTAPKEWTVAGNSLLEKKIDAPDQTTSTWTFEKTPVMSTYLATFLAGPYHVVNDSTYRYPIELYCRATMAQYLNATATVDILKMAVDYYEKKFGIPYPFKKIGLAWVPDFTFGAMENPGLMTFMERTLPRGAVSATLMQYLINVNFHEVGHHWFGDLTTMVWWNDLWLNESFATFVSHLGQDEGTPYKTAAVDFANSSKAAAISADQKPSTHPISVPISATDEIWGNFDRITYEKGSSVLQQLHAYVGADAFWNGIHTYLTDRAFGNATLADLLSHLEKASGRKLETWAKLWLEQPGVNTLEARVETAHGKYTSATLLQGAAQDKHPTLRPHRLQVGLYDFNAQGCLVRRGKPIAVEITGSSVAIPEIVGKKKAALVLVNDGDWTFAKVALDKDSLHTVLTSIQTMKDPLARTLCNGTLWNMTRDGALPVRDYISCICRQSNESVPSVLESLLAQAQTAIRLYAPPSERQALKAEFHQTCGSMLEKSVGTPFQLSWFDAFVATAHDAKDVTFLKGLLSGSESIPGFTLHANKNAKADPELRWKVVLKLSSLGSVTDIMLAAEGKRDPSALGKVQLSACSAARPTAKAKRDAWKRLMSDGITVAEARSIGTAMWQPGQEHVLKPYYSKLAAAAELWCMKREEQTADNLLKSALPIFPIPEVMQAVEQMLASSVVNEQGKIILRDLQDDLLRAVYAQTNNLKPLERGFGHEAP